MGTGALFVLSVVLSCSAKIGIVAAFGQVTASLCEVPCRAVGSTIHRDSEAVLPER